VISTCSFSGLTLTPKSRQCHQVGNAIKSATAGGTTPRKGGAMSKKKMLQVDEVLALVIGSLLASAM
jgi:hypothetical protein